MDREGGMARTLAALACRPPALGIRLRLRLRLRLILVLA